MNKNIIVGVVVVIVLILGGWWVYSMMNQPATAPANQNNPVGIESSGNITTTVSQNHDVMYTDAGYSPSNVTIKVGDTVTFKNQSSGELWTASGMHPSHIVYSGTSLQQHCPDTTKTEFDECTTDNPGESWSFTFTKTGTWSYHNHANASKFGKITVEQ